MIKTSFTSYFRRSNSCDLSKMRSPLENLKSIIIASKNYDYEDKN
ncbi:MAG: hypothetical protein E6313_03155 [Finegoldia magna]|nr:hypothetical protein [Finegoldia magna]MDU7140379.1 hypothetical protein [Finegoldia magna]